MTESKQEAMLRKIRGLYAKANSTEHSGEREVFMAKADQLMEQYAIDTWMLQAGEDTEKAKLIVKRLFDVSWWNDLGDLSHDSKSQVWHLFQDCVTHCRCYTHAGKIWNSGGVPVYGMAADLDYLNLLFTDLFIQLFAQVKPTYDPNKSLGHNVAIAKQAGMKYIEIALWLGKPEWRVPNGTGGYKTADKGKMLREYKKYVAEHGGTVVTVHPSNWAYSFIMSFRSTVAARFKEMRGADTAATGGNALVVRDIREAAQSAMFDDFPELRKGTGLVRSGGRRLIGEAAAAGGAAGSKARIADRSTKLGASHKKGLGK
jgi:hypothetical protein